MDSSLVYLYQFMLIYNNSSSKVSKSSSPACSSGLPRIPRDIVPDEAVEVRWERLLTDCSLKEKREDATRDEGSFIDTFCLDSLERRGRLDDDSDRGRPEDLGREEVSRSGLIANSTSSGSVSAGGATEEVDSATFSPTFR